MTTFFADFSTSTFLTSLVGSGTTAWLVVRGLSGHFADRWLAKYKSDLDKEFESYRDTLEQKRKRLEAELSHRVYTTQTQFDTEFNTLKDIFAILGKIRLTLNGMRPHLSWGPTDKTAKLEALGLRLTELKERYNMLVDSVEGAYPFVPEDIYEEVQKCMQVAHTEVAQIETGGDATFTHEWFREGEVQQSKFGAAYFAAASLARERFKRLSVAS